MNNNKTINRYILSLFFVLTLSSAVIASEDEHATHTAAEDEHEATDITLNAEQIRMAGIKSEVLRRQVLANEIQAPGEIRLNDYATVKITSRIDAQVIKRHAKLGDEVKKGQSLVTLSSVAMAEAQGELLVAEREWARVKKLGRKVVSDRRNIEAQVARQRTRAKVLAYGMSQRQIARLLAGKFTQANGQFKLSAPQAGIVIDDAFILGEMITTGRVLFTITDESVLWVEVRVSPEQARFISVQAKAKIRLGKNWMAATVIQIHHRLDEKTRTQAIRLSVNNIKDKLHPGLFVLASIESATSSAVLSVPKTAILRSPDGDWQVFIEEQSGVYEAKEINVIRTIAGRTVISGIQAGTRIVIQGAFFLQSEQAKSGFEIHNH